MVIGTPRHASLIAILVLRPYRVELFICVKTISTGRTVILSAFLVICMLHLVEQDHVTGACEALVGDGQSPGLYWMSAGPPVPVPIN